MSNNPHHDQMVLDEYVACYLIETRGVDVEAISSIIANPAWQAAVDALVKFDPLVTELRGLRQKFYSLNRKQKQNVLRAAQPLMYSQRKYHQIKKNTSPGVASEMLTIEIDPTVSMSTAEGYFNYLRAIVRRLYVEKSDVGDLVRLLDERDQVSINYS